MILIISFQIVPDSQLCVGTGDQVIMNSDRRDIWPTSDPYGLKPTGYPGKPKPTMDYGNGKPTYDYGGDKPTMDYGYDKPTMDPKDPPPTRPAGKPGPPKADRRRRAAPGSQNLRMTLVIFGNDRFNSTQQIDMLTVSFSFFVK